jgi:hypothetical protein
VSTKRRETFMTSRWKLTGVFAQGTAILLGCAVFPTQAQTPPDQWQFSAILYGYFPTLKGSATFPSGTPVDITVDPRQILNSLNIAGMGAFELRRGAWGLFTDIMYLHATASKSATRDFSIGDVMIPAAVTANIGLDVKSTIWTLAGSYRAIADPGLTADIVLGARDLDLEQHVTWQFSANVGPFVGPGRQGSGNFNPNNFDAIVGFKGRAMFGTEHAWFVPYYLDLGGGNSDYTWQGILGVGQCGVIVRAGLRLMPAPTHVMIQELTYTDLDAYLTDHSQLASEGRFDSQHGRMMRRQGGAWSFTIEIGKTFTPPNEPNMWEDLPFASAAEPVRMTYHDYLFRFEARNAAAPAGRPSPVITVWIPASATRKYLDNILSLPPEEAHWRSFGGIEQTLRSES